MKTDFHKRSAARMTEKRLRARRSDIIKTLAIASSNGWANAILADWKPLEAELDRINKQLESC